MIHFVLCDDDARHNQTLQSHLEQILPALPLKGDINNDGTVDIVDAMLLFYHVAKKELLSEDELSRGDLDGDGFIDISDAMLLFYFVAKKITEL